MLLFPVGGITCRKIIKENQIMEYKIIDRQNWDRKIYFEHYLKNVPCTYSLTAKLDVTRLKHSGLKFYPAMLYYITKTVNAFEQFRTAFRDDGKLVIYNEMSPSYTVFHKDSLTFSNLWTEYSENINEFCRRYEKDFETFGTIKNFYAKPDPPENLFTVSMIPWISFDGFNLNTGNFNYLLPIFTVGKYQLTDGKYIVPFAVQVHHAVCDGYHVCCFINKLQENISSKL